jgi:hypothetical protein
VFVQLFEFLKNHGWGIQFLISPDSQRKLCVSSDLVP